MAVLRAVFQTWKKVGEFIGDVIAFIALSLVFYLVLSPLALFRRLIGQDPLSKGFEKSLDSYKNKSETLSKETMERPY